MCLMYGGLSKNGKSGVAFEQTPVMLEPTDCEHVVLVSTYDVKCGIATYTRMLAEQISGPKTKVSILAESESPLN